MIDLIDFDGCKWDCLHAYGGRTRKIAVDYYGVRWMLEFPEFGRIFSGFQDGLERSVAHTNYVLSEYIASQIHRQLGIRAQETMLGKREGRIVVAYRDFAVNEDLYDMQCLKNTLPANKY